MRWLDSKEKSKTKSTTSFLGLQIYWLSSSENITRLKKASRRILSVSVFSVSETIDVQSKSKLCWSSVPPCWAWVIHSAQFNQWEIANARIFPRKFCISCFYQLNSFDQNSFFSPSLFFVCLSVWGLYLLLLFFYLFLFRSLNECYYIFQWIAKLRSHKLATVSLEMIPPINW